MAKYGIIIAESRIAAYNLDSLNRSCTHATADVDGGNLVSLTASTTAGNDVFTAATPTAQTLGGLWMAYNPSVRLTEVDGQYFAGLSADDRHYTNIAGRVFDVFKPKKGDILALTLETIDASGANAVAGDILESKASQTKLQRIAAVTGATSGSTAFKILRVETQPFPQAGVGMEMAKKFIVECIQE